MSKHCSTSVRKEVKHMKIAVAYDPSNGEIFQHYGLTEYFKVYDINVRENKVESDVRGTEGKSHGGLTQVVTGLGVDILICGGIGGGAQKALVKEGVRVFAGCTGNADTAIEKLMKNELVYREDYTCEDHHHDDGEDCMDPGTSH